ncbi:MAG: hypothetical protein WC712_13005 [Candidatus Brocadiia bacterium]
MKVLQACLCAVLMLTLTQGCSRHEQGNTLDAARKLYPGIIAELLPPTPFCRSQIQLLPDKQGLFSGGVLDYSTSLFTSLTALPEGDFCGETYDPVSDSVFSVVTRNAPPEECYILCRSLNTGETLTMRLSDFNEGKGVGDPLNIPIPLTAWDGKIVLLDWGRVLLLNTKSMTSLSEDVRLDPEESWPLAFARFGPWAVCGTRWLWYAVNVAGDSPKVFTMDLEGDMPSRVAVDGLRGRFAFTSLAKGAALYYLEEAGPRFIFNAKYPVIPGLSPGPLWFDEDGELYVEFLPSGAEAATEPAYFHISVPDGFFEPRSAEEIQGCIPPSALRLLDHRLKFPDGEAVLAIRRRYGTTPFAWMFAAPGGISKERDVLVLDNGVIATIEPFAITLCDSTSGKILDVFPAPEGEGFCQAGSIGVDLLGVRSACVGKRTQSRHFNIGRRSLHVAGEGEDDPWEAYCEDEWSTWCGGWEYDAKFALSQGMRVHVPRGHLATAQKDGHMYIVNERTHAINEVSAPVYFDAVHPIADDLAVAYSDDTDRVLLVGSGGKWLEIPDPPLSNFTTGVLPLVFPDRPDVLSLDLRTCRLYKIVVPGRMSVAFYMSDGMVLLEDKLNHAIYLARMTACEPDAQTADIVRFVKERQGK